MSVDSVPVKTLIGRRLLAKGGERLGRIRDVVARLREGEYPTVSGLVVRIENRDVFVSIRELVPLNAAEPRLVVDRLDLRSFERRPREVLLAYDVLGRHVIHVKDARLVRVVDLEIGSTPSSEVCVTRVLAGRRRLIDRLLRRPVVVTSGNESPFLDWAAIEPLLGHVPSARRRLPFTRLARLHPAALADMVEAASPSEGEEIMRAVGEDRDLEADVFEELDTDYQVEFLHSRPDAEAADILAKMAPDDAADLVLQLDDERRERILGRLPLLQLQKVRMLLGFNPETAGGLMSTDFIAVPAEITVEEALTVIRTSNLPPTAASTIYVLDTSHRLTAALSLVDLIRRSPSERIGQVVVHEPAAVQAHADIPEIALKMADFNLESLPVVDDEQRLIGIIAVDDLLETMMPVAWRSLVQRQS